MRLKKNRKTSPAWKAGWEFGRKQISLRLSSASECRHDPCTGNSDAPFDTRNACIQRKKGVRFDSSRTEGSHGQGKSIGQRRLAFLIRHECPRLSPPFVGRKEERDGTGRDQHWGGPADISIIEQTVSKIKRKRKNKNPYFIGVSTLNIY